MFKFKFNRFPFFFIIFFFSPLFFSWGRYPPSVARCSLAHTQVPISHTHNEIVITSLHPYTLEIKNNFPFVF